MESKFESLLFIAYCIWLGLQCCLVACYAHPLSYYHIVCRLTQLALSSAASLGERASLPCCSQVLQAYLQSTFFGMRRVVILEHVCQKQSCTAMAKPSRSTVAILRWPKAQRAGFQRGKPAAGVSQVMSIVQISR